MDQSDGIIGGPISYEELLVQKFKQLGFEELVLEKHAYVKELGEKIEQFEKRKRITLEKLRMYNPDVEKTTHEEVEFYELLLKNALQRIQFEKAELLGKEVDPQKLDEHLQEKIERLEKCIAPEKLRMCYPEVEKITTLEEANVCERFLENALQHIQVEKAELLRKEVDQQKLDERLREKIEQLEKCIALEKLRMCYPDVEKITTRDEADVCERFLEIQHIQAKLLGKEVDPQKLHEVPNFEVAAVGNNGEASASNSADLSQKRDTPSEEAHEEMSAPPQLMHIYVRKVQKQSEISGSQQAANQGNK